MVQFGHILGVVEEYYSHKVRMHGPTARGVDWNSLESQRLRFQQLMRVRDTDSRCSIIDYGCGYGALADYVAEQGEAFTYQGLDLSDEMVRLARDLHRNSPHLTFVSEERHLEPADYAVASGVFNVRLQTPDDEWLRYFLHTVERLDALSRLGFAFNALTKYSDANRMRPDLYYADPLLLFDHCKRHYSERVALLHDYPLYEFTILVRK